MIQKRKKFSGNSKWITSLFLAEHKKIANLLVIYPIAFLQINLIFPAEKSGARFICIR